MKQFLTFLTALLFSVTIVFGQTPPVLEKVEEGGETYWIIDSPEDLIWVSDTFSLDANNDGVADIDSLHNKMFLNYRLAADITFDPDSSKVDWNNDGTIDLVNSVDSIGFEPIGGSWPVEGLVHFQGSFDGQYYTISNLYSYHHPTRTALFGRTNGATIENLRILNFRGHPIDSYISPLIGRDYGESEKRGIIRRCWTEGTFYGLPTMMDGDQINQNVYLGGIAGRSENSDISECYTKITAHAETTRQRRISGIVGRLLGSTTIKNCYSVSFITAEEQSGIIVGGINNLTAEAALENCYSVGLVVGKEPRDELGNFAGSIGSLAVTSCYWDKEKYGDDVGVGDGDNAANVVGLNTADFATEANFVGWDFTETWEMGTVDGDARPVLQWQKLIGGGPGAIHSSNSEALIAYPNPVSGKLTVDNAPLNVEYRMINMIGQTMESGVVTSKQLILNVEDYKAGIYMLKVGDSVNKIIVR
jgi:hypothetical protein